MDHPVLMRVLEANAHSGRCGGLHFSDDGRYLYSCGAFDGTLKQFDLRTIDRLKVLPNVDERADFLSVFYSPGKKWLVSIDATRDQSGLIFWDRRKDYESPKKLDKRAFELARRQQPRWCDFIDDDTAVMVHQNGVVQLYHPESQRSLGIVDTGISVFRRSSVSLAPSRQFLSVCGHDGKIAIVDLQSLKIRSTFTTATPYFRSATLLSNEEVLIAGDSETLIADYRGKNRRTISAAGPYGEFQLAPNHRSVVGRGHWGRLMMLNLDKREERWSRNFDFDLLFCRYSADSRRIVVGAGHHGVLILDAQDGSTIVKLGSADYVRDLAIAPGNEEIVYATHGTLHRRVTTPLPESTGEVGAVRTLYE